MKRIWITLSALLVAGLVAGVSFWGGMTYQTRRAEQVRARFLSARGGNPASQSPGPGQAPGFFGGGGTTGQVKSIQGDTLTLSTAQNTTTVHLTSNTRIEKYVAGTSVDLQPGQRVMVIGQQDSKGNLTAERITILSQDAFARPLPTSTSAEP